MRNRRFDILDAWRSLAILLMLVYHFLFDLYIFGVITWEQLFCTPLHVLQRFICCSFILLAGASARFACSNLRHGLIVLAAGVLVEVGAAVAGQSIRFGILMFMGTAMLLYHFLGDYLQKTTPAVLGWGSAALYFVTQAWTQSVPASVGWLYPLGFTAPGFYSVDYFPLMPWFFLFLLGTVLGGWCLENRERALLTVRLPGAITWLGRHSLIIYILHQPVLYGISFLIWG